MTVWNPQCHEVDIDGVRLRVAMSGAGSPVLLLNGIGGNVEMWESVVPEFTGRKLIMIDCPAPERRHRWPSRSGWPDTPR